MSYSLFESIFYCVSYEDHQSIDGWVDGLTYGSVNGGWLDGWMD